MLKTNATIYHKKEKSTDSINYFENFNMNQVDKLIIFRF